MFNRNLVGTSHVIFIYSTLKELKQNRVSGLQEQP